MTLTLYSQWDNVQLCETQIVRVWMERVLAWFEKLSYPVFVFVWIICSPKIYCLYANNLGKGQWATEGNSKMASNLYQIHICRVHGLNQHTVKINGLSFAKWLFLGLMYECPLQRYGSFVLNFQCNSQWTPASWSLISRRQPLSDRKPHGRESLAHLSENHLSISIQRSGGAGFIPPVLEGDIQCLQILFHRLKTPLFLRRNILLFPVLLFGFGKVCVTLARRESI